MSVTEKKNLVNGKLMNIPENPGVYLMKQKDIIIYIGKAKNLKKRVYSYFSKDHSDEKTKELVKKIEDIDFIICNTEVDALILENNLIKEHSPKYNVALKDEKTYPYIRLSKERFPSLKLIRTRKHLDTKNAYYFGPYPHGSWKLIKVLIKLFKIRDCNRNMDKKYARPCLKYYMKLCDAPCVYKDIETSYNESVEAVKQVLKGNTTKFISEIKEKMEICSKNMEFERAIFYREQINELENIQLEQIIEYGNDLDEDVFVFKQIGDSAFISVLNLRDGKVIGKTSNRMDLKNKVYDNILETIILGYYFKYPIPKHIVFQSDLEKEFKKEYGKDFKNEMNNILTALTLFKKSKIFFYFPKVKSKRKSLLEMALSNLDKEIELYFAKQSVREEGLKELYNILNLSKIPRKIECFDISNIQGKDAVASMSVSVEGRSSKKDYRKFKIKVKDTPDDFEMMREVIRRRYGKLDIKDFPDMILIDGGLGQINAAGEVLISLNRYGISDLLSLAKKNEEVYKYGISTPYIFSKDKEALKILQRVRDEAHRFGITYHRKLRSKRIISSELDDVKGIGEKRKMFLLKKYGSVKEIEKLNISELEKYLPRDVAINLKNKFSINKK